MPRASTMKNQRCQPDAEDRKLNAAPRRAPSQDRKTTSPAIRRRRQQVPHREFGPLVERDDQRAKTEPGSDAGTHLQRPPKTPAQPTRRDPQRSPGTESAARAEWKFMPKPAPRLHRTDWRYSDRTVSGCSASAPTSVAVMPATAAFSDAEVATAEHALLFRAATRSVSLSRQ